MALVVADRVKETTTTTGTGTYTLAGAVHGFQSFAAIGNGNTCYYACSDGSDYEVGIGTYTLSGTTLARTTILESSNNDAAVNWGAGEKDIFVTLPASKAIFEDASNNVAVGNNITVGGTVDGRNLSVDGAKLDNIEANATADQTAAEIEAIVNHDNLQGFVANEHIDWTASSAGTIHATNIPVVALTTVQTAANQTAHLALTAQEGDIVVRSDENKSYVHNGGSAGTMADYTELLTPTDAVLSVNGQTGAVTISNATTSSAGLMSSADKSKLDGVESGATADQTITAGAGLTGGGTGDVTISHADTSSQASVNGSGRTYIQDIILDTYGHVTGLATATETVVDTNTTDWRVANSAGTEQFAVSAAEQVRFAASGAASVAFNSTTQTITISATDTNTDTTNFDIQANGGTEVNISAGENINFINGGATTAVVTNQANPTVTFNHNDTSSQASVNNSNGTVIQDVTLDGYGHVTALGSVDLDSRYVNVTGDTMTGELNVTHNGGATGSTAPTYSQANIELQTSSNHAPAISFHRGGYSAGVLYEYDGQIYSKAWLSRSQDGLLLSSGNIGSYAWTSSNDGSGSGLDADTVDGLHASSFLRSDTNDSYTGILTGGELAQGQHPVHTGYYGIWNTQAYSENSQNYMIINAGGDTFITGNDAVYIRGGDNSATNELKVTTSGSTIGGNTVWHAGNDGSGSGLDADTVDGIQASSFLRSDTNDTASGVITFGPNPTWGKYLKIGGDANHSDANTSSIGTTNGNLHIDSATSFAMYLNYYDGTAGVAFGSGNTTVVAFMGPDGDLWKGSADNTGSKYWHAGNDGSGSGLDADLLDGIDSGSFLRSNADDTFSGDITTTSTNGIRFGSGNQTDSNDGFIAAGRFNTGLNIVGTQTTAGTGRQVRVWGSLITDGGQGYWHAGNDGAGSGLDADLLDGYNSGENGASVILRSASNGYLNLSNWVNIGASGIYSGSNINGAHFTPNQTTSYGTWATTGSRGGYDGILFDHGGDVAVMFDASGNGGFFRQASGLWYNYYNLSNQCTGFNTSTTSSSYTIYASGAIYATGNITAYSDARIKENVVTIDGALDKVNAMRGVYYNKIDDPEKTKEIGFIAQEVNEVLPEAVTYAEDVDQYGVKYGNVTALLVEAVKELSDQVRDLKAELEELKNA